MKFNKTISSYIFMEMIPTFVISLAFFTFVFLVTSVLNITKYIVNYHVDLKSVLLLLIYSMPFFLEFIIPMSIMMAVLLSFLRLSSDNEIVALKSGGVSIYALLPPVLLFCTIGCIVTAWIAIAGLPKSRLAFKALTYQLAISNFDAALKEKTFNDSFPDIMLYIGRIDPRDRTLGDVFIEDNRAGQISSTIIAPRGRLYKSPDQLSLNLRLFDGMIQHVDPDKISENSLRFDTYDFKLELPKSLIQSGNRSKDEEEMTLGELKTYLQRYTGAKTSQYYLTLMEYHKKFSLPAACFALGLLAVPLGIQSKSSKKSFGVGLGFILILIYYLLLSTGWVFGEKGTYPPLIGMWVPNIVMGGIGLFLIVRVANERYFRIDRFKEAMFRLLEKFRKPHRDHLM